MIHEGDNMHTFKKKNYALMNKFYKRSSLKSSTMQKRRNFNSLNRVGAAYGVAVDHNGQVSKRVPKTASSRKRRIKYKSSNNGENSPNSKEIFENKK